MEVTKQAIENSKKGKRLSIDSGISFPPGDDDGVAANGVAVQTDRSMLPGNHGLRYKETGKLGEEKKMMALFNFSAKPSLRRMRSRTRKTAVTLHAAPVSQVIQKGRA